MNSSRRNLQILLANIFQVDEGYLPKPKWPHFAYGRSQLAKKRKIFICQFFRKGMEQIIFRQIKFFHVIYKHSNFFACVRFQTILDENAIIHFQKTYDTLDDLTIGNIDNDFDLRSSSKVVKFVNNFV